MESNAHAFHRTKRDNTLLCRPEMMSISWRYTIFLSQLPRRIDYSGLKKLPTTPLVVMYQPEAIDNGDAHLDNRPDSVRRAPSSQTDSDLMAITLSGTRVIELATEIKSSYKCTVP